ncbi:hypothetical protein SAMN06265377_0787 [Flagellimonas pacifica]|uniref:Uncharacterized protein n=1 Tax=Flagellimonas pacifica TaxID=1247520 RepID=A0A285MHZ0_9FLAO|nr:hypothetical protein SAMN06265377_0787 [Allomuricauda parva]
MCKDCFLNEILKFESQSDFEEFEFELLEKVSVGKVTVFDIEDDLNIFNFENYYQCNSCAENWIMSAPNYTCKGYFLIQKNAIKYHKKLKTIDDGKLVGCCFISAVFLFIILWHIIM